MSDSILKTKKTDILSVDPRTLYVQEGWNVRIDMGDLDALADSIASIGQQVPLKVVKDRGAEKYRVIDGHRRYKSIMIAIEKGHAIPYVKVEIFNGNSEDEIFTMIVTGTGQKQLNEVEQAEGVKRLVELGYTPEELSTKVGKSVPYMYNLVKIANFPKMVKDEIVLGAISASTVVHMAKEIKEDKDLIKHVKKAINVATKGGTTNKKATTKHVDVDAKKLNDVQKMKQVYDRLIEDNVQGIQTDIFELILFKVKNLSVDEILAELNSFTTK